jgi:tripartite-type tricarboxylate transporter receptor subunit TctC
MKSRLDDLGLVPVASTPPEFARFLKEDLALQARIVKAAGLQPQ